VLGHDDLLSWFQRWDFPEPTRSVINRIRTSGPSRRVGGGSSNVCGRYPSKKMGVTVQFESHRVELAGIYEMEHDPSVLEYFDQPPPIKLTYESPTGRSMGVWHTPDFFVIRDRGAGWEEWKTEEELQRRSWCSPRTRATVLRLTPSWRAIRRREAPPYHKRMTSLRVTSFMPSPVRSPSPGSAPPPIRHPAPAFENEARAPLDPRG